MLNNNASSLHNNQSQGRLSNPLPHHIGYMRLPMILRIIPISKSTWWLGVREGRFPKGIKLSSNITAWKAEDIYRLIENNCRHIPDTDRCIDQKINARGSI